MSAHNRSIPLLGGVAILVILAACDGPSRPTTPPPPPSSPPVPSPPQPGPAGVTVSGVVLEFAATGEQRPVPNLRLKVRTEFGAGATSGIALDDTVTDAQGRYTITGVTSFLLLFQTAPGSDYRCLCDDYPVVVRLPVTDIPVVHTTWSGNRPPPNLWFMGTSFWGTVSERVGGSPQPVEGATVDWGYPDPPATTSATGFYMICSMSGSDQFWPVTASKTGYNPAVRQVLGGWDHEVHFELTRR